MSRVMELFSFKIRFLKSNKVLLKHILGDTLILGIPTVFYFLSTTGPIFDLELVQNTVICITKIFLGPNFSFVGSSPGRFSPLAW